MHYLISDSKTCETNRVESLSPKHIAGLVEGELDIYAVTSEAIYKASSHEFVISAGILTRGEQQYDLGDYMYWENVE